EVLAISAVTNRNCGRIDARLKRDLAAMTAAIHLHGAFLLSHHRMLLDACALFLRPGAGNFNARRWHLDINRGLRLRAHSPGRSDFQWPEKRDLARKENTRGGQDARPWLVPFLAD